MKRVREDASVPSRRGTRTASAPHDDEGAGRRDTAASPIRAPAAGLPLLPPRPPASPRVAARMAEVASKTLDAQSQAFFFRDVQADDQLAEVAYQRGLLATFAVSGLAAAGALVVEAPEFATVDFLKRRVTRAKLEAGEWCPPDRFELKRRLRPGEEGGVAEPLPETDAHRVPTLLFNLGYRAGQGYELTMVSAATAAAAADREHQDAMLRAAGVDPAALMTISTDPMLRSYQQLLQGSAAAALARGAAPGAAIMAPAPAPAYGADFITPQRHLYQQQAAQPQAAQPQTFMDPASAGAAAPPPSAARGTATRTPRPNRAGRWSIEETRALVTGVAAFGMSWARIHDHYKGNIIDERRTPVDYKDKWRNLVKVATDPTKQTRTQGLDEDIKTTVLRLAQSTGPARGELALTPPVGGGDEHSGMAPPGTGGI